MTAPPDSPAVPPRRPPVLLLVAMVATVSFSMNAFVPSIPGLVQHFQTTTPVAQLALTLFLLGVAIGQPVIGPLSDRHGRRPVLLIGLAVAIGGSLICLVAPTIEVLVGGRLIQALGACTGMAVGRAIVGDVFGREKGASVLGYLTAGLAVVTTMAPAVGGLLDVRFGWRATFVLMLVFFVATWLWSWRSAAETNFRRIASIAPLSILANYRELLGDRRFLGYTLVVTFTSGAFFAFVGGVPHLMINVLHRPADEYGLYFGLISITFMAGNFLTGRLSQRIGLDRMLRIGVGVNLPAGLTMLALALAGFFGPLSLFLPMAAIALGNGLCQPNATAGAIATNPRLAGSAAGLLGMVQMLSAAVTTFLIGVLQGDTPMPLAVLTAATLGLGFAAAWLKPGGAPPPAGR
jgi:DHA1 family bicyclomycin/chloramphenicol resistance-like MFS transporter